MVNFYKILSLTQNEKVHSEFLAWLLSPYEQHGFGDAFFCEIIGKLKEKYPQNINIQCDNLNLKVNREYSYKVSNDAGFFDIFIRNADPNNKFICLIENKINAKETNNQLERYGDFLSKEFNEYKKLFIFLKPDIQCDIYPTINRKYYYIGINHEFIKDCIENIIENCKDCHCKSLIEQYLEILPKENNKNIDEKIFEDIIKEHKPELKKMDNNIDFYSFEDKSNPKIYWAITNDNSQGAYYINICVKPKEDENPNYEVIEEIEKLFDWKGKVNFSKNGFYWFGEELQSDNKKEKIEYYISKAYEKICL